MKQALRDRGTETDDWPILAGERTTEGAVGPRFNGVMPMMAAPVMVMPACSAMKSAIPLFNSDNWDAASIAAGTTIH